MQYKGMLLTVCVVGIIAAGVLFFSYKNNINVNHNVGDVIDRYNGSAIYYNGGVGHVLERNTTSEGYNLGLKYQCVEFVKRYYYERFSHKMPDSYGHAKDFFNKKFKEGEMNTQRNLLQYASGGITPPMIDDIIIFSPSLLNPYGHVAIISDVGEGYIEIVQQNPGPFTASRAVLTVQNNDGHWSVAKGAMGWLRLPPQPEG